MKKQLTMTTAMAAALLTACSSNDGWNEDVIADRDTAVCVDKEGRRVDDDLCSNDRGGSGGGFASNAFLWYYIGRSTALPYYGDSIYDSRYRGRGSFKPTLGTNYARAPVSTAMTRSQAVSRGGLGSRGRSFGGARS